MRYLYEIYDILNEIAPFSTQESWDNSGIQIGSLANSCDKIYASLDIDTNLVNDLEENSLLITHHPLIFKGLKSINYALYPSNLIAFLLSKNISVIAMHTNYDKAVLNRYFTEKILGLKVAKEEEFLNYVNFSCKFDELCFFVKERLNLPTLKVTKSHDDVSEIAICTGSGADLMDTVLADTFLTGDIKYHSALEAYENDLNLIDITHYASERCFAASLKELLQKKEIEVIITNSVNPLSTI